MLVYSSGLRMSEVVKLRIDDIDGGRKDGYTVLSDVALGGGKGVGVPPPQADRISPIPAIRIKNCLLNWAIDFSLTNFFNIPLLK